MNNETNMELINEVAETGAEIVTNVTNVAANGNGLWKKVGVGTGLLVAGALACKGIELAIDFGKSKFEKRKAKKNEEAQVEAPAEDAENIED